MYDAEAAGLELSSLTDKDVVGKLAQEAHAGKSPNIVTQHTVISGGFAIISPIEKGAGVKPYFRDFHKYYMSVRTSRGRCTIHYVGKGRDV